MKYVWLTLAVLMVLLIKLNIILLALGVPASAPMAVRVAFEVLIAGWAWKKYKEVK